MLFNYALQPEVQEYWKLEDESITGGFVIPGIEDKEKDISIFVEDGLLNIKFNGNDYLNAFHKKYSAPNGIKASKVSVKYELGVLKVTVAKPKKDRSEIKVG